MLVEFQQALADMTACPELCADIRRDPSILDQRYDLTERERRRLVGIVGASGMACACMVYRANRLAPLALNIPQTCRALGKQLRPLVSEYWAIFPEGNVHFFIEADRFCRFLKAKLAEGRSLGDEVTPVLERESAMIADALRESMTETAPYEAPPLNFVRST
jgi:hypothetical protein